MNSETRIQKETLKNFEFRKFENNTNTILEILNLRWTRKSLNHFMISNILKVEIGQAKHL